VKLEKAVGFVVPGTGAVPGTVPKLVVGVGVPYCGTVCVSAGVPL
jgi:hypothetical protein